MTYEEAIEKIHEFNVFGSRLGLERMKKLLSLLGDPHEDMKIIHAAGTNGKGSVCRYLYTVLGECGYKVGAYFSPYLQRFTERIECGGSEIKRDELPIYAEKALTAAKKMVSEGFESPTEFELVTAIGLLYFKEQAADFVILEVGLGGRGDSTNICDKPVATVITSISYDHTDRLGDTLEKIAYEKAGIIKSGVPVSVFVEDRGAFDVINKRAAELHAPLTDLTAYPPEIRSCSAGGSRFSVEIGSYSFKDIEISMAGRHQINNAVCALSVIADMRKQGFDIPDKAVKSGMKKTFNPGRFEVILKDPYIILDGAHNEAGVTSLTETLLSEFSGKKILLCTGILADKEFDKMAAELSRLNADVITTSVPNPRTMDAEPLGEVFRKYAQDGIKITVKDKWEEAVKYASEISKDYDVTVWAGSLYLIGAVRGCLI